MKKTNLEVIMETNFQEGDRYYQAKKRVEDLKGFYGNLTSYIVVNIFLAAINLVTSPGYLWFFWPLLGWGVGVFFHAMKVFNWMPFFGKEWEEQKIKEFMEKEKQSRNDWK